MLTCDDNALFRQQAGDRFGKSKVAIPLDESDGVAAFPFVLVIPEAATDGDFSAVGLPLVFRTCTFQCFSSSF